MFFTASDLSVIDLPIEELKPTFCDLMQVLVRVIDLPIEELKLRSLKKARVIQVSY